MCWGATETPETSPKRVRAQQVGACRPTGGMDSKPTDNLLGATTMLQSERKRLVSTLETLDEQRTLLRAQLRSVDKSLAALAPPSTPKPDARTRLSRDLVLDASLRAIEGGPKNYDQLKAAVLSAAREQGVVGTGVHLILQQVVNDPQLEHVDGLYRKKRIQPTAS